MQNLDEFSLLAQEVYIFFSAEQSSICVILRDPPTSHTHFRASRLPRAILHNHSGFGQSKGINSDSFSLSFSLCLS